MPTWNYIVIVLSLMLLAFTGWHEWKRANRKRLVLRLLASFVAAVCFACLTLPLTRSIREEGQQQKQAVLLTEGFNEDSLGIFLQKNKNTHLYSLDKKLLQTIKNNKIEFVAPGELALLKKEISKFHLFGYGLNKEELEYFNTSEIRFHPSAIPNGFLAVNWQHKIKSGDRLRVQGKFLNTSSKETKLIFSGYGVNLDTAIILPKQTGDFELTTVPKQVGKAVFSLTALAGNDTINKEPVPFETEVGGAVKVLILSASPDFENKFLKSWLSQNNYSLVSRTTISKNKYDKTFLNTPQVSFASITASFLNNFNLLIADVNELAAISRGELAAIESQVAQKGMGLVIKTDSAAASNAFYASPFPVLQNPDKNQKELSIFIPVSKQYAPGLAIDQEIFIRPRPGTRSLIEDKQSNTVVGSTIYGAGRLVFTTLNNTFSWMLSGDEKNYTSYWSYLLEQATAKSDVDQAWSITPAYPYANKAVQLNYTSNNIEIPRVQVGQNVVHLSQHPDLPFQWQGSYWPGKAGWQPIMQDERSSAWWYAYAPDDWKTMQIAETRQATLEAASGVKEVSGISQKTVVTVPLSKIYFLILFLCSVGFLWIEKKL